MFEKWLAVILITLLPPLVPPYKGGKQEKSGSLTPRASSRQSRPTQWLPFIRGGLGWGKKYLAHQS